MLDGLINEAAVAGGGGHAASRLDAETSLAPVPSLGVISVKRGRRPFSQYIDPFPLCFLSFFLVPRDLSFHPLVKRT